MYSTAPIIVRNNFFDRISALGFSAMMFLPLLPTGVAREAHDVGDYVLH